MAGLVGAVDRRGRVVSWWTFPWPAVPFVNGQIETGSDGKQYRYDARANDWVPVTETPTVKPPADREVGSAGVTPPPSVDPDKFWAARNAEARPADSADH